MRIKLKLNKETKREIKLRIILRVRTVRAASHRRPIVIWIRGLDWTARHTREAAVSARRLLAGFA